MNFIIVTRMRTHKLSVNWNRFLWHVFILALYYAEFSYKILELLVASDASDAPPACALDKFVRKLNLKDAKTALTLTTDVNGSVCVCVCLPN